MERNKNHMYPSNGQNNPPEKQEEMSINLLQDTFLYASLLAAKLV